jgi:hypothetical protein
MVLVLAQASILQVLPLAFMQVDLLLLQSPMHYFHSQQQVS